MSVSTLNASNSGIIIQYDFCDGCHACEMACKQEHDFAPEHYGIKIMSWGPKKMPDGKFDYVNLPVPTGLCDMCADRLDAGKLPACVHHCPSKVMEWGGIEDLARKVATIKGCALFAPGVE